MKWLLPCLLLASCAVAPEKPVEPSVVTVKANVSVPTTCATPDQVPAAPAYPKIDVEHATLEQLAAAEELYATSMDTYAKLLRAIAEKCSQIGAPK